MSELHTLKWVCICLSIFAYVNAIIVAIGIIIIPQGIPRIFNPTIEGMKLFILSGSISLGIYYYILLSKKG